MYTTIRIFRFNHRFKHCIKYARLRVSLSCVFPYKDKMVDFVLIRENAGKRKPVSSHILHSECFINLLQYLSAMCILKKSVFTNIFHCCKYCVADTENNEFLLKLFQNSSSKSLLKLSWLSCFT